jgi:hypothetical protein
VKKTSRAIGRAWISAAAGLPRYPAKIYHLFSRWGFYTRYIPAVGLKGPFQGLLSSKNAKRLGWCPTNIWNGCLVFSIVPLCKLEVYIYILYIYIYTIVTITEVCSISFGYSFQKIIQPSVPILRSYSTRPLYGPKYLSQLATQRWFQVAGGCLLLISPINYYSLHFH